MAQTYKIIAQSDPSATTLTDVYTVPASTSATISSLIVCNRSSTSTTFRVSIAAGGAADANSQYLYYDVALPGNDTFVATIGVTLATTDKLRAYVGAATVTVSLVGVEIT